MTIITSTTQLPDGWLHWYTVRNQAEAMQIADGQQAYLYQPKHWDDFMLYIPVNEKAES
jgi:hypothetical protein